MNPVSMSTLSSRLAGLGQVPPTELTEARLAIHWAAQTVAAFGFSLVPARDDFSHTTLRWSDEAQGMLSQSLPDDGLHAALHPVDFAISLRRGGETLGKLALDGRTLDEIFAWLAEALTTAGRPLTKGAKGAEGAEGAQGAQGVTRPGHLGEMPAHPVANAEPFAIPPQAHREALTRWLAAADALIHAVVAEIPGMGPVHCWPHHFDTASLHVLEGEGESMRSVGVGLSPGDGGYPEPYVYVTPWPYPAGELPVLPWGHWHTEGWTGAVLRGSDLLREPESTRSTRLMEMIRVAHRVGAAAKT
ncbi:MAG: hypothetical protein AAGF11_34315 [Myxococcota bacterium]